jgi:hypothetical protein
VNAKTAFRYRPEEPRSGQSQLPEDGPSLVQASIQNPIATGSAVTGWVQFWVPKDVYNFGPVDASIELNDYLGETYAVFFKTQETKK